MGTQTVIINPDRFVATRIARAQREISPVTLRRRLRAAGLPANIRAPRPDLATPLLDLDLFSKLLRQQYWTRLLIDLVSR